MTNASDLEALVELLCEPYVIDSGALEALVEQSQSLREGSVGLMLAALSNRALTDIQLKNVLSFAAHAARLSSVSRELERSTRRKGRCPKRYRNQLRSILEAQPKRTRKALPSKVPPQRADSGQSTNIPAELDIRDVFGSIDQVPTLLDRIGSLPVAFGRLDIRLAEFTYASALAIIAQWLLVHGKESNHSFPNCPPAMSAYLTNIRFGDALLDPQIVVSPDPMDWAIGLTRINRDLSSEVVTEKIVDILTTFTNPTPRNRSALVILISEMIENVHRHAAAGFDGFAVAQVYPKRLKMGITLVDAGMGVRRSFEVGEPSIDVSSLKTDEDFLRAAVTLHATSKSTRHSGYGLYLLSELISRNRGTFLLSSGKATLFGYRQAGKLRLEALEHEAWAGTIVSVIIDLHRDLPLLQIYKEMPLPEGMTDEDYFTD